jgi:hypothetical protein
MMPASLVVTPQRMKPVAMRRVAALVGDIGERRRHTRGLDRRAALRAAPRHHEIDDDADKDDHARGKEI